MTDRLPLTLRLYRATAAALAPLAPGVLAARARRGREDAGRLGERLGRSERGRPGGRLAWLHGVSVGESLSLLPLIERVRAERPDAGVLVTSGTRASAEILADRIPEGVIHQYAPVDTPAAVAGFLDHWRPDLGVLAESELWPGLILAAEARGVRLALVSARLSPRSAQGWSRAPAAARRLLGAFDLILARDEDAAAVLRRLGASVSGLADLKFGAAPPPVDAAELARARDALAGRPLLLAASTHSGEDAIVLDAFARARGAGSPLLAIAPRHPRRGGEIETLALARGFATGRRGRSTAVAGLDVHVADTLGELGLWYRLAAGAFVGGSLSPGVGGHNPLEAARLGCPVAVGPHTGNWPVFEVLERFAAVTRVASVETLATWFRAALGGTDDLRAAVARARAWVEARDDEAREASGRIVALLPP
ncbi:MAG: glycosyltransferase N-terminal domain-containing protein [Caulobacteraceae bacterium]